MARIFFLLLCITASCKGIDSNSLQLEQVLIFSRHNIRTPLTGNLEVYSPKIWTKFNESVAHLTKKGTLLESYMAEYISEWLSSVNFLKGCPKQNKVLIYSNTKPRTRDTAKSFAKSAFPSCNITAQYNENIDVFDPMFHPIFRNNSESYKQQMISEMKAKLNSTDLSEAYSELNRILDIKNSEICKQNNLCDLNELKNEIVYEEGEEPELNGPIQIGTNIVDNFIMSYYEGFPLENVAWGQITTGDQWNLLTKIIKQNQDVRFNFTTGSKDLAAPLLKYMFNIFRSGNPKFTLLVGHDSNLNSIINGLRFKAFHLENQFEPFPIGGKLVFQKWSDGVYNYLKVEYFYQTTSQLRNGDKLSLAQPPKRTLLELKDCKTDESGFCSWNEFVSLNY